MDTGPFRARLNPRRATAARQQSWVSCSQAPRPGSLVLGSGTSAPPTLAKRRSCDRGACSPHPAQVLMGTVPGAAETPAPPAAGTVPGAETPAPPAGATVPLRLTDDVGVLVGQGLVGVEPAVARARQRGVRAAPAV